MRTMKNPCILLLLVVACSGLSQDTGQGGHDGGDLQLLCGFNQNCVPYFQCVDGYINTDGAGLIDITVTPNATCINLDYPEVPATCCNHLLDVCPGESVCMQERYCRGLVLDNNGNFVNYSSGGSWSKCQYTDSVCCLKPDYVHQAAYKCGVRHYSSDRRISSNRENEAEFGEFPWQAIIFKQNYTYLCGGSLIGDKWLLTAAHCFNGLTPGDIRVRLGEWKLKSFDESLPYHDVNVANVSIHPSYNHRNLHNDIAVLQLYEPMEFQYHINTICLPSTEQAIQKRQPCIATGWGRDAFTVHNHYQHILRKVDLLAINPQRCQNLLRATHLTKFFILDDSFMCAVEENKDDCYIDGGDPLACKDPYTGHYVLSGIKAWGIGCGMKGVPGVYVDVQGFLPFIESIIHTRYE